MARIYDKNGKVIGTTESTDIRLNQANALYKGENLDEVLIELSEVLKLIEEVEILKNLIGYDNQAELSRDMITSISNPSELNVGVGNTVDINSFNSLVSGQFNTIGENGNHSCFVSGTNNFVNNTNATALGMYLRVPSECQTVVGRFNVEDTENKYAFIVGNGDWRNGIEYSNAFTVDWNGEISANTLTIGVRKEDSTVGVNSTSIGINNTVSGDYSFANGENNTISGDYCHHNFTNGSGNTITSYYSTALGSDNTITSSACFASGGYNTINSGHSFASGDYNIINGWYSTALGYGNTTNNSYSVALGYNLKTNADSQTVVGKYNVEDSDKIFIVGNGAYSSDGSKNSNAFAVSKDGNAYVGNNQNQVLSTANISFNTNGELVVSIGGITKTFVPKE